MTKEPDASSTLLHYRIVSKLGAGGMGEVYLAQDTKLDRKVALKILPADVASRRDRMDRFVREAKSAAALNALVHADRQGIVSNLWRRPLDGGTPSQLTDFKSLFIDSFCYSRDGRQLVLARGSTTRDAVLITDEK